MVLYLVLSVSIVLCLVLSFCICSSLSLRVFLSLSLAFCPISPSFCIFFGFAVSSVLFSQYLFLSVSIFLDLFQSFCSLFSLSVSHWFSLPFAVFVCCVHTCIHVYLYLYICTCVYQQVIFRNDRFWHLLLSSIIRSEDTLSAVSVAAGFDPISFMSDEWQSNPARVEAARLSSMRGGLASAAVSSQRAAELGIFCRDGTTGDGLGLCLIGKCPLLVYSCMLGCMRCMHAEVCAVMVVCVCLRGTSDSVYSVVDVAGCIIRWCLPGTAAHGPHGPLSAGARPPRPVGLWDGWRHGLGGRQLRASSGTRNILR